MGVELSAESRRQVQGSGSRWLREQGGEASPIIIGSHQTTAVMFAIAHTTGYGDRVRVSNLNVNGAIIFYLHGSCNADVTQYFDMARKYKEKSSIISSDMGLAVGKFLSSQYSAFNSSNSDMTRRDNGKSSIIFSYMAVSKYLSQQSFAFNSSNSSFNAELLTGSDLQVERKRRRE